MSTLMKNDKTIAGLTSGMKLLWENPNPNAEFPAQNITLASNNYDLLLVIYGLSNGASFNKSLVAIKDSTMAMDFSWSDTSVTPATSVNYYRTITPINPTTLSVGDGVVASGLITFNGICIPLRIYGIKL